MANFATWHKLTSAAAASQLQLQLMNKTCIYAIVRGIGYWGAGVNRKGSREYGAQLDAVSGRQVAAFSHPAESVKCFCNALAASWATSLMEF